MHPNFNSPLRNPPIVYERFIHSITSEFQRWQVIENAIGMSDSSSLMPDDIDHEKKKSFTTQLTLILVMIVYDPH